jgi:hypothetical protein
MKRCSICGIDKPLDQFHSQPSGKFGRHCYCKQCFNARYVRKRTYSREQKRRWNLFAGMERPDFRVKALRYLGLK